MTPRERINNAIDRKSNDRTPYSLDLTGRIVGMLADHYGIENGDLFSFLRDDLLYVFADESADTRSGYADANTYEDNFGVVWDRSDKNHEVGDWGAVLKAPISEPSLTGYEFPNGKDPKLFAGLDEAYLKGQSRFVTLPMTGLFDICWHLRGFENFMADMAGEKAFAGELLDNALEYSLDLTAQIPGCVDGVRIGEDWGLQRGLITGPSLWRGLLKPRLRILYEAVRKKGLRLMIHSCGDIAEIFPDIIEIGVEVAHPVQPEAMDIGFLHREYGRDITMYGGLGSQSTLVYGGPEDIIREAESRLSMFKGGGYIIGPAGAVPTDARPETVIALTDFLLGLG